MFPTNSIEKRNDTDETIPCLRNGCSGVRPHTLHQCSTTARVCVVLDIEEVEG